MNQVQQLKSNEPEQNTNVPSTVDGLPDLVRIADELKIINASLDQHDIQSHQLRQEMASINRKQQILEEKLEEIKSKIEQNGRNERIANATDRLKVDKTCIFYGILILAITCFFMEHLH